MEDIWRLIQRDQFEEACNWIDKEYADTKNLFLLNNKCLALLHLRKYGELITLAEFLIKENGGISSSNFINLGIACWFNGDKRRAVVEWQKGDKAKYQDLARITCDILLYFSAVMSGDTALKQNSFKKIGRKVGHEFASNWPVPLGLYLTDQFSEDELMSCLSINPVLNKRQSCQAYFVLGIKAFEKGDFTRYRTSLIDSVLQGSSAYLEYMYYIAKGLIDSE